MIEAKTMSSRWRAVSLLIIATLQVLLVWTALRFIPRWHSLRLIMLLLFTATLVATGYDIAMKGRPTRLALCFWLPPFVFAFAHDIGRAWNHDPNVDPVFTLLFDAFYIFMVVTWVLQDPFGPKKTSPVIIKKEFT
jgi:hypothetical protein